MTFKTFYETLLQQHGLLWLKVATLAGALFSVVLGTIVIIGWYTHNLDLIQIDQAYVPMQYNTALCFMLSGLAFICVIYNKKWPACILAFPVALIGLLTLIQYIFTLNVGIDQLFMQHYVTVKTSQPGRMAPNTALCFTIVGSSLMLMSCMRRHRWTPILTGVTGALVLGLGLVAFTGYLMGIETAFGWGALTRMAIHTSLGFIVLSIAFLMLAVHQGLIRKADLINYRPLPSAIVVVTISVLLWQALHASNKGAMPVYDETLLNLVLVFGGMLALALAWAMNRTYEAQVQAYSAQMTRQALERDIIERKQAEAALRESEERFRSIFENAAIGIAQIAIDGRYLQINESFCRIIGYSQKEVLSSNFRFQQITHPDDLQADLDLQTKLLQSHGESFSMEKRYIRKNGHVAWVNLSVFLVRDSQGSPLYFVSAGQDITESKALQQEIERQARVDYLTGLYNRRYFMEEGEVELARALRYKKPLSLMMLDIDYFKRINDTYGHKTGDLVLQRISLLCQETLREVDIIGRMGGEEFAILLPETKLDKAIEVAERLRVVIEKAEILLENGLPLKVTVSIGVANLKSRTVNIDILLHAADVALYEAKNNGRNQVSI